MTDLDNLVAGSKIFLPADMEGPRPYFNIIVEDDIRLKGQYVKFEANREGIKLLRLLATRVNNQHKLYADGGYVEMHQISERSPRCLVCGELINIMAFKSTPFCSEGCRRLRENG